METDNHVSGENVVGTENESIYRVVVAPKFPDADGHGRALLTKAQQLGFSGIIGVHTEKLYFLLGALTESDVKRIGQLLLADPVT